MTAISEKPTRVAAKSKADVMREIYRRRGYIVLWQAPWHERYEVGTALRELGGEGTDIGLFRVRAQTTLADFRAQQLLSKKIEPRNWKHASPTAAIREWRKKTEGNEVYWKVTRTTRKMIG